MLLKLEDVQCLTCVLYAIFRIQQTYFLPLESLISYYFILYFEIYFCIDWKFILSFLFRSTSPVVARVNGRAAFRTVLLPEDNGRLNDLDEVESAGEFNRLLSSGNRTVRKAASPLTLFIHINKDLKSKKI